MDFTASSHRCVIGKSLNFVKSLKFPLDERKNDISSLYILVHKMVEELPCSLVLPFTDLQIISKINEND